MNKLILLCFVWFMSLNHIILAQTNTSNTNCDLGTPLVDTTLVNVDNDCTQGDFNSSFTLDGIGSNDNWNMYWNCGNNDSSNTSNNGCSQGNGNNGNCGNGGNNSDEEDEDDDNSNSDDDDNEIDEELNEITCPSNQVVGCGDNISPEFTGFPTSTSAITFTYEDTMLSDACPMIWIRTWTIVLSTGETTTCVQTITIIDETAPIINVLGAGSNPCELANSLEYTIEDCDPQVEVVVTVNTPVNEPIPCAIGSYRSQTQGGWGAQPNGNNPAVYLYANFDAAFPNGLTIGCSNSLILTTPQSITAFLPSGSTPSPLPSGALVNPGSSYTNVLAGQLVAATLNVGFDAFDPNFGASEEVFENLIIAQGPMQGMSVSEMMIIASEVIGGCSNAYSYSTMNEVLTALNENFDNGTANNGYFVCPNANTENQPQTLVSCLFEYEYTITATDQCGNVSVMTGELTISDEQAPVFDTAQVHLYLECGDEIPTILVSDDCGTNNLEVTYLEMHFSGACIPTLERTYTATDACGNSSNFVQYIHFEDTQAPLINGLEAEVQINCGDSIPLSNPQITDACGSPEISYFETNNMTSCAGNIIRSWTATDECGNTSSFTQTITRTINSAPEFTHIPASITLTCGSMLPSEMAMAIDDCGEATVTVQDIYNSNQTGCQTLARVFTATDACGASTTATQYVYFVDNQPPTFTTIPGNLILNCGALIPMSTATASDNCDMNVNITASEDYLIEDCQTTITRTFLATDNCGNMQMAEQVIILLDNTPPQFTMPSQVIVTCNSLANLTAQVTDNCSADIIVTHSDVQTGTPCNYTITRTYTAMDLCGNSSQFVQTIQVSDTQAPQFTSVPASYSTACTAPSAPTAPTAIDNCAGIVPVIMTQVATGGGCNQQIVRTWTATDPCGNTSSVSQTIQISDHQPPVIMGVPQNYTMDCQTYQYPSVPSTVVVTDNCATNVQLQFNESTLNGDCAGSFTIIRTWTATDQCGNTTVANQSIYVNDTTAPVWNAIPANIQLTCGSPMPSIPILTAMDNCTADLYIDYFEFEESTACGQQITRVWSATDECGNTAERTQLITVIDQMAPTITPTAPSLIQVNCDAIPNPTPPLASDNCSSVVLNMSEAILLDGCPYHINRTWTATDGCGNSAQWIQTLEVFDNQVPEFVEMPLDVEVSCDAIPTAVTPNILDCSDVALWMDETSSLTNCPTHYDIMRIYTATDICGQTASYVQTIHVVDNQAPLLVNVPSDLQLSCGDEIPTVEVTAMDNCDTAVDVVFTETITNNSTDQNCSLSTPEAIFGDVALWLPGLNGIGANYTFVGQPTFVADATNGSALVQAEVANTLNADHRWLVELHLVNSKNWSQWNSLGRQYKDDLGVAANHHQDWTYYELSSTSSAVGLGALSGSTLQLTHAPSTYYYGFQVGERANNRNLEFGMSGWIFYNGIVQGNTVSGHGDFFANTTCCASQTIDRTWSATDCAGNTVTHTQSITIGNTTPLAPYQSQPVLPQLEAAYAGDESFQLTLRSTDRGQYTVEMFDMHGRKVSEVFNGAMDANSELTFHYATQGLKNAFYFFKLSNGKAVTGSYSMMMR